MRRYSLFFLSIGLLLIPLFTNAGKFGDLIERVSQHRKVQDQYIVTLKDDADPDTVSDELSRKHGGERLQVYKFAMKGFAVRLSEKKLKELQKDPRVASITEDYEVSIAAVEAEGADALAKGTGPQILAQTLPTGVNRVNAENKLNKGENIEVAVIDTGIQKNHPDLQGNLLGGYNCLNKNRAAYDDQNGHGTHVAGTIAAVDNGVGAVGVAPKAKIWAVRVLDRNGNGTWSQVICGIDWVTSQSSHIKIASMSLGGGGVSDSCTSPTASAMHKAICRSVNAGVTYVVAAGNNGGDVKNSVPAAYPEVIAVSALADSNGTSCGGGAATSYGPDDTFASFSNYATLAVDAARLIGAPGVSIYSTWLNSGYNTISGTSMATPHVSGAAALYLKKFPGSTPAQIKAGLLALAEAPNVNVNSECATGVSHVGTVLHPEPVLRADSL